MIAQRKLEDLIREKIFLGPLEGTGFHPVKCQCCNDYKPRGGFKFNGDEVGYNCFNCGIAFRYEERSEQISRNARKILNAFGIDDTEISTIINSSFFNRSEEPKTITLENLKKINTNTPTIKLPAKCMSLGTTAEFSDYQEKLITYLLDRKVNLDKYHFYFSLDKRYVNHVIIPFYRNGNLIFWQARNIVASAKKRYDNCTVPRDAVIFNYDQLYTFTKQPLLVTEGAFDAMMFDGIAILGSSLCDTKVEILKKTNRRLIFVIDKDKTGRHLAEQVLSLGWEITFAPDGADDINKSVQRFGRSWSALQLMNNIPTDGPSAKLLISMRCKNNGS